MLELILLGIVGAWVVSKLPSRDEDDEDTGAYMSSGEKERNEDYGKWKGKKDNIEAWYDHHERR